MSENALLSLAALVLCGGILVPFLFPRWTVSARLLWRVTTLVLLTLLIQQIVGSPLQPDVHADAVWDRAWRRALSLLRAANVFSRRPLARTGRRAPARWMR